MTALNRNMKTGRQTPTFEKIGDYAYSYGAEVADMFAEDGGATFYPAQLHELELMLARNADGSPAATTIGLTKPRQNGKSYTARYYAIYMAVFEHRDVLTSPKNSGNRSGLSNRSHMALNIFAVVVLWCAEYKTSLCSNTAI